AGPRGLENEKFFADLFKVHYDEVLFVNTFFKNLGQDRFQEISDQAGLETFWPWGIATGDFDNDGWQDIFIPSGMGYPFWYWLNYLKRNQGDGTFTDWARAAGIEPPPGGFHLPETIGGQAAPRSSRAAATADFDHDGRLDLVVNNFNDHPYYFRNQFPQKNYVAFRLRGTRSNQVAGGALLRLYSGKDVLTRIVESSTGYLAQSSKTLHIGLGERNAIDRIEIRWPSGARQTIQNPAINKLHDISEPR